MRGIVVLACVLALTSELALAGDRLAPAGLRLAQAKSDGVCAQVISCGTKDGKRKQYSTPCAARDDGATEIAPMTGSSCDNSK